MTTSIQDEPQTADAIAERLTELRETLAIATLAAETTRAGQSAALAANRREEQHRLREARESQTADAEELTAAITLLETQHTIAVEREAVSTAEALVSTAERARELAVLATIEAEAVLQRCLTDALIPAFTARVDAMQAAAVAHHQARVYGPKTFSRDNFELWAFERPADRWTLSRDSLLARVGTALADYHERFPAAYAESVLPAENEPLHAP